MGLKIRENPCASVRFAPISQPNLNRFGPKNKDTTHPNLRKTHPTSAKQRRRTAGSTAARRAKGAQTFDCP